MAWPPSSLACALRSCGLKHLGTSAWVGRGEVTFQNVLENSQNIVVNLVYLEKGEKPHYTGKT